MPGYLWCAPFTDIRILIKIVAKSAMRATRLRFPQKILPNSRGKGISYQSDVTVVRRGTGVRVLTWPWPVFRDFFRKI